MDTNIHTDDPKVMALWLTWQMTLKMADTTAIAGSPHKGFTQEQIKRFRELFAENYAAIQKSIVDA